LHRQYEALAEKTEQLKILEESLNQGVADKPQGFVALDESLPVSVNESANDEVNVQPKTTNKRHLFFIILAAASLLFLLVLLLKRRQLQHRARDIDNWSLDTEPFLSVQPEDSLEPKKSLEQEDSLEQENTPVPEVSAQASDGLGSSLGDSIDHDYGKDDDSDMPPALPAEGAVELEAAVYIAYERFDEAEDLLEQALEIDSDNEALQMQLLEVYAAKGKARHFDLLANQIHNHDNDRIIIKINYLKSKL
jgi:tetratricopeptide (TPR) repeat protein